jgi:predicted dehydrogenase
MIQAAIVGLGWWGQNLVKSVQGHSQRLRFTRGVSKEPAAAREVAARHDLTLSTSLEDVLADPAIDAVVLATPHSLHADQIVAAAAAGKHVFCEKPLALDGADARRAIAACERAGRVLGLGTNKRFWPSMVELRRVVAAGELGELLHIEGHFSNENSSERFAGWRASPAEAPGGGMTGAGLHLLDAVISIAGPLRRIRAQLVARKPPPDPRDTVSILFETAGGITGTLATVRATPFFWRVHVFGREASVEALGETGVVRRRSGGSCVVTSLAPADALLAELDAFAAAIAGEAPYPVSAQEMLDTVDAFEAVLKSAAADRAVTVGEEA